MRSAEHTGCAEDPPPSRIALPMKPYQLQAISWMRQMEGLNLNSLFWEKRAFADGGEYWFAPDLGECRLEEPPEKVHAAAVALQIGSAVPMVAREEAWAPAAVDAVDFAGWHPSKAPRWLEPSLTASTRRRPRWLARELHQKAAQEAV